MNNIKSSFRRSSIGATIFIFVVTLCVPLFMYRTVSAAGQFSPRKLTPSSSALGTVATDANGAVVAPGAGGNGAKANHTFTFTFGTSGATIGSLVFQYCTTPFLGTTCTAPTGMDASTLTTIATQTGFSANNFTLDTTTVANTGGLFSTVPCSGSTPYRANCILIKRASASAETGTPAVTLGFGQGAATNWIKNPTVAGTFFVRITAFSDTAYTTIVDQAAVAGAITTQIDITAKVQEKLNFSVAAAPSAPGASCTALAGTGALALGDANGVLDIATAYDAHSYFRVSTNASGGTNILYSGDTLKNTSGNAITAVPNTQTGSVPGTEQFGLAIDSSDTQSGNGYSFTNLAATTPYDAGQGTITAGGTARFAFSTTSVTTPIQVAGVTGSTISCDTGSVRYLGNIGTITRAGIYKTTITYIAVPTF